MREYKFRAKRKDNGEWVYGYFTAMPNPKYSNIHTKTDEGLMTVYRVDPKTVGQYITEIDGQEFYEGDIADFYDDGEWIGRGKFRWDKIHCEYVHSWQEVFDNKLHDSFRPSKKFWLTNGITFKKIGNIHEEEK